MKRLALYKKQKTLIVLVLVLFFVLILFLIYNTISNPGFVEQKNSLFSYNTKSKIDYNVHLKPNNLYDETTLAKGRLYITEFVDYVDTNIIYEFVGERDADIKGEYNVAAKVTGSTEEEDKILKIWEKEFSIKQNNYFNSQNGKVTINEKVKLNLNEYNTFVQQIKETSKISCDTTLTLSINVNISGNTDKGNIEETISSEIVIPLDVPMFEITENNMVDQAKAIEETIQVQLPVNRKMVIIYCVILVILLAILIMIKFIVKVAPEMDPMEKELKKIFRKHGDRLVAINSEISDTMAIISDTAIKTSIIVNTFDDLVRTADELSKPIFYKYSENYKEINSFYVSNENERYLFKLEFLKAEEDDDISTDSSEQINVES